MTDSGRIGLNEVELGIPVPKFWQLLMARVVGVGVADKLCSFAQMLEPERALEVGLIDEIATSGQLLQVRWAMNFLNDLTCPVLGVERASDTSSSGRVWCACAALAVGLLYEEAGLVFKAGRAPRSIMALLIGTRDCRRRTRRWQQCSSFQTLAELLQKSRRALLPVHHRHAIQVPASRCKAPSYSGDCTLHCCVHAIIVQSMPSWTNKLFVYDQKGSGLVEAFWRLHGFACRQARSESAV
jgi:hypothetical protein